MLALIIISSIFGGFGFIFMILKLISNSLAKLRINVPRTKYIYYNNKKYYYTIRGAFLTFLSSESYNKIWINVYSVNDFLGFKFKRRINKSDSGYYSNNEYKSIDSLKNKLIRLINEYNDKDSVPGWDGCLDEISRQARKRAKNIDTIIDE